MMSWRSWDRVRLCLASVLIGYMIGVVVEHYRMARQTPEIHPLKVTILDDGGADLKVESTVAKPHAKANQ